MPDFTPIPVTVDDVMGALRSVVAERPDYRYVNRDGKPADATGSVMCHYVHDDKPGCIVGTVLHKLGVPLEVLSEYENLPAETVVYSSLDAGNLTDNRDLPWSLHAAQRAQDDGNTWATALAEAEGTLAETRAAV